MATVRLPEWRAGTIPPRSEFATRFQLAAQRAGVIRIGAPRLALMSSSIVEKDTEFERRDPAYRVLGTKAPDWLATHGRGPYVEATAAGWWANAPGQLRVIFALQGQPVSARWLPENPLSSQPPSAGQKEAIASILTFPLATARAEQVEVLGGKVDVIPLPVSDPPETVMAIKVPASNVVFARRIVGSSTDVRRRLEALDIRHLLLANAPEAAIQMLLVFGSGALFIFLLVRRRIDLTNGAILGVLGLLFSVGEPLRAYGSWFLFIDLFLAAIGTALAIFFLWSAAESWIRSTTTRSLTSLDTLRAGQIGPKGGSALLHGWAAGAAVAGLWLIGITLSTLLALAPTDGSVHLPMFSAKSSIFSEGVLQAGFVLLAIGAALLLPVIRGLPYASTILAGLFLTCRIPIGSFGLAFLTAALIAAVLLYAYSRFGLSALLTATIVSVALPGAVYSAKHLAWLGGSFVAASAMTALPLAVGVIGLMRSTEVDDRMVSVPTFVRRLEEERRVQHEMDLLARMQLGLLPLTTPVIAGYQVAARSILATEASGDLYDFLTDDRGQVWIAAGDVSGHGYSCAIAQAMTKAGLASLVGGAQTPASVLAKLDQVLRSSGTGRTFTSLALLRLDPTRAEGLIANAGYPYPLMALNGEIREVAVSSLPLGQGPARTYENTTIRVDPGDVVIFCSDGLFEALDVAGQPYGFDRLRGVVGDCRSRSAEEILECVVDDWRKHIGRAAPEDDTTVVVLKRMRDHPPAL
jgi:serine phosphatase RsbU (regulator of sigma subunit)